MLLMATCLTSIGEESQIIEFSSGITYRSSINQTKNAIYMLSNELDQSVFFSVRVLGVNTNIAITLTIYNSITLRQFGTLNISQNSINSSFNITSGSYYVCIRAQAGSYDVDVTPTFISYSNVATFNARSYFGFSSSFSLEFPKPVGNCNRKLLYTIIEGDLPEGLTMLDNGYISGILPTMDCDPANDHLPTSNSWYHKISDSEYITSWGRAYRFRVSLRLYDEPDSGKIDIKWFYLSVVNNFSKNQAIIDKYEVLEDSYIVTFEDQVKLNTLQLCPGCDVIDVTPIVNISSDSNNIVKSEFENSGTNSDGSLGSIENNVVIKNILFDEKISQNEKYEFVEDYIIEDESNIVSFDSEYDDVTNEDVEYIQVNNPDISVNGKEIKFFSTYTTDEKGLVDYYIDKFNADDNLLVLHLNDSCMFQTYLKENNISEEYINLDVLERFDYSEIVIEYIELDNLTYIKLKNSNFEINVDMSSKLEDDYIENYLRLPLTSYSHFGFASSLNKLY